MKIVPDPDALDAALAVSAQRAYYVRGCNVGHFINDLEPGPFRDRLIERMLEPSYVVGHSPLSRAIKDTTGVDLKAAAIQRHRARLCTCFDAVWS